MSETCSQIVVAFTLFTALGTSITGVLTDERNRQVLCRRDRFDFKNIKCEYENSEQTWIGLRNVMFGYLNETVNCTETNDTFGCEEQMSNTQMIIMIEKGSAQQFINALQFPAVDIPKHCKGYDNQPVYMAFIFDCLKGSSIANMCNTSSKTGQRLSVYNPGYPVIHPVHGTHHCECSITSPSPVIIITIYDYRLNCTGNNQNLTIEDANGVVLDTRCDSFQNGQRNSSNQNLTMVWKGQRNMIGLFWIGFHADDAVSDVTVECYPIWDPTTTTTTTTTTSTTSTTTASTKSSAVNATASFTPNGQTEPKVPATNVISNQSRATTTTVAAAEQQQRKPMPKTVIYGLAAAGGGLFLVIIIVCVIVVKRRSNSEGIDPMQMQNMNAGKTKEQMKLEHSVGSQNKTAENRRRSSGIESENKGNNIKTRKVSNNALGTSDEKTKTSEQLQDRSKEVVKGVGKDNKHNETKSRRESAASVTSKEINTPRKISRKVSETTDIDTNGKIQRTKEGDSKSHPSTKSNKSRPDSDISQSRRSKTNSNDIRK